MKKRISLLLIVVMIMSALVGCNLVEYDYNKDYAREVVVINPITTTFTVEKPVYDEFGLTDQTTQKEYTYTSPEVRIYKSQLNNYVYSLINERLNSGMSSDDAIDQILKEIVEYELTLIEADRLFYAGQMYWTKEDIDSIMTSVYSVINSELTALRNELLTDSGKELPEELPAEEKASTTYPVKAEEVITEHVRASYYYDDGNGYAWHNDEPQQVENGWYDDWYLNSEWYIEDQSKYFVSYPGVIGDADTRSAEREALNSYLSTMFESVENYIGITDEQLAIVRQEMDEINHVKNTKGVEFTYPMLGKTLIFKLLVGDTYLRNAKANKLQAHIEKDVSVSYREVEEEYYRQLNSQRDMFVDIANYDSAVTGDGGIVLYNPTNRYVFVKHILLQFSDEQKAQLEAEKKRLGTDEDAIEAFRANLAKQITAYEHKDGEDDKTKPAKTGEQIFAEVKASMARYINTPKYAEREFDNLIYKYNQDPGIFGNRFGYAVVYELNEGESETYMTEFAEGARAFRDDGYSVGQILSNYVVTDYGIHIMYYAGDPTAFQTNYLNSYTTVGEYETYYEKIEEVLLANKKATTYNLFIANHFAKADKEEWASYAGKIISEYKKEISKQIYG